jgi:hypothetical protein
MTSMLATLNISKPIDESSGKPIEPTIEYDNPIFRFVGPMLSIAYVCALVTHIPHVPVLRTPNPFECDIRPRSEQALKLIKQL